MPGLLNYFVQIVILVWFVFSVFFSQNLYMVEMYYCIFFAQILLDICVV